MEDINFQSLINDYAFGLDCDLGSQRGETPHLLGFAKRGYSIGLQRKCVENVASFNAR